MKKRSLSVTLVGLMLLLLCGCGKSSSDSDAPGTSKAATIAPTTKAAATIIPTAKPATQAPTVAPTIKPATQAPTVAPATSAPATKAPAKKKTDTKKSDLTKIKVTSETLTKDGKWLTVTNNIPRGLGKSPQLSWEAVEGATCYAVYMLDKTVSNYVHWKAANITTTSLELGAQLEMSDYFGPCPPSDTHEYEITVYALKQKLSECPGTIGSTMLDVSENEKLLDEVNGTAGNIIGKGTISGTVTYGEKVE